MLKNLFIAFSLLLFFNLQLKADIAPDQGFERASVNLIIETKDDLSDYRFFLDFYGDLREVEVKSTGRTEIPPMGGGARYSSGTLLAIHKKTLDIFGFPPSDKQTDKLSQAIKNKEVSVVEIAKHRFSMDVPKGEKPAEIYYVIKVAENTLKTEKITADNPSSNSSVRSVLSVSRIGFVIGGILITLAVLAAGIFAFRKASKKV